MTTHRPFCFAGVLVALCVLLAGTARCQIPPADRQEALVTLDRGTLGVVLGGPATRTAAVDGERGRLLVFDAPPRVLAVLRGGPSAGRLAEKDVILAVDGRDVTTPAGSRLLQRPDPDATLDLRVRRGGRELRIAVTAGRDTHRNVEFHVGNARRDASGRPRSVESASDRSARRAQELAAARASARSVTNAWYGVGLATRASVVRPQDKEFGVIHFEESPRVYKVDQDSPADLAGIRRGDVLVEIEGEPLVGERGAVLFSSAAPGDTVSLRVLRGGEVHLVRVAPADFPVTPRPPRPPRPSRAEAPAPGTPWEVGRRHLRYAGAMGDVDVEVRGIAEVSVMRAPGELHIDTGTTVVVITLRGDDAEDAGTD